MANLRYLALHGGGDTWKLKQKVGGGDTWKLEQKVGFRVRCFVSLCLLVVAFAVLSVHVALAWIMGVCSNQSLCKLGVPCTVWLDRIWN